ncbi:Tuberous sclerosis 2-like protein [Exophiala xenobiotica]|nr:Tuberous sclerosis 2-like protein [Exophiala xenobiotica]KAK5271382.1 Tuberous sclerosis 2-like protein [Exophiala xenobiotica]KAK5289492.1 Tuberous sclerosis 2-like protein [Exophiala xenobiotica]KAK5342617.1 Tuberous sclerosis 2-like protein [Exophiala xenobiotica]KAK5491976.1 Tuberous sclerosis 2-like protein [Exophiala xenobiotica]
MSHMLITSRSERRSHRMSTEKDASRERSANTGSDREGRRRSIWHVPVLTPKSHSPDNAFQQDRQIEKEVPPDGPPLDMEDVLEKGFPLSHSPEDARAWLLSFGDFKSVTDVSLRFVDLRSGTQSLLSVLNRWLPAWSSQAEKARKENKNSRSTALKESKNLDWLLRYIYDYLNLGHSFIDPRELAQTVDAITTLCLNASRHADINSGINVLYAIASHFEFPKSGLEQSLVVLSASAANLQEAPDHLFDCTTLLATGQLSREVIGILYTFIRVPTLENNSKNLSHARGASRLLRNLLGGPSQSGGYAIDVQEFVEQLHSAASQGIFRFCHDILSSLHAVLGPHRSTDLGALDFGKVMEIIHLCLKMTPYGGPKGQSPIISPNDDKDRSYDRHYRDREAMMNKIAHDFHWIWEQLSPTNQDAINKFFLDYPRFADTEQMHRALRFAEDKYLGLADHEKKLQHIQDLFERVVQDPQVASASRITGIQVLVQASNISSAASKSLDPPNEAYTWMLAEVLDQLGAERDGQVLAALLIALEDMACNHEEAAKEPALTMRVIDKVKTIVLSGSSGSIFTDELAIIATRILATIFCYSIHINVNAAVEGFDVLQQIAGFKCKFRSARLVAKRLLFRVRADEAGFIYINGASESQDVASALLRTRDSADVFHYEVPTSQRHSASSTSLSTQSDVHDPMWLYPDTEDVTFPFTDRSSSILNVDASAHPGVQAELDMDTWLMNIIRCLQADIDWETYSYTIIHVAAQLSNIALFLNSMEAVVKFRQVLCEQMVNNTFREAPPATGLKKSDVALCLFNILVPLIAYATMKHEAVQKGFGDDLVRAFLSGIGGAWEGTPRPCIHALSICSLEIPSSVASLYPTIIDKMSKNMTQAHLTAHILEFLIHMALLPEMHSNLNTDEIQIIFGICIQFLEKTREQHSSSITSPTGRLNLTARHSGMNFRRPPYRASMLTDIGLPQYAAALAYHVIIFWFLSLQLEIRAKYVSWIVARLVWKNSQGQETIDEQSQVLIDMMQRTAFSDLGETAPEADFAGPEDGPVSSASWIVGLSVITAQTAGHTGKTEIIKRQASGTTYARYQQLTSRVPSHHAPSRTEIRHHEATTEMLPSHIILQMVASAASTNITDQPLLLPDEDFVRRGLESFDRIPTVSSHKIGILYIGEGQSTEPEYLANMKGSRDYARFLDGLGYVVSLQPPLRYNPQGLEYPRDGESTIAWRNRVDEIVYHVPTMMPTDLEEDPYCVTKKAHVGNCHVNIVFNRSGLPWSFDNFKSQLNYVNIMVIPACRARQTPDPDFMPGFYWVQVITRDDLPNLSPAADPKIISAAQLAAFVRAVALNASYFCQCWNTKDLDSEFPSGWRARLQQIKRLRERVMSKSAEKQAVVASSGTITSVVPGTSGGRRTPVPREEAGGPRRDGALASQLDFSSWTVQTDGAPKFGP